jgi:Tetratricopeptide repeat
LQAVSRDSRLVEASRRPDGRVTQFLAGGPELERRYRLAPRPALAIISAAMDGRRLECRLSDDFLKAAAPGYLDDETWDSLDDEWFNNALEYLGRACLGVPGPLTKIQPRPNGGSSNSGMLRLSDYLEQLGRAEPWAVVPPQSFWDAAVAQATTIPELLELANSAQARGRFRNAAEIYAEAARRGHLDALLYLADYRELAGDPESAIELLQEAIGLGAEEATFALAHIYESSGDIEKAERLLEAAGDDAGEALVERARLRRLAGDSAASLQLLEQAVELGSVPAMSDLAVALANIPGNESRIEILRSSAKEMDSARDQLIEATRNATASERRLEMATENLIRLASRGEVSTDQISEILDGQERRGVNNELIIGRVLMARGLTNEAKVRFARAIDAGSIHDRGYNPALNWLAKAMATGGDGDTAKMMLKYGLEIGGRVAGEWKVSFRR